MTNRGTKRVLALCLSLALLLGMLPPAAFAAGTDGPCENHPAHDADCGYIEGTLEIPCDKGCTELDEAGAVRHAADCAYVAAAGHPCDHTYELRAPGDCIEDSYNVMGNIYDKADVSIEGAQIIARNASGDDVASTVSDSEGYYILRGIPDGSHTLSVSAPGYQPASVSITVASADLKAPDVFLTMDTEQLQTLYDANQDLAQGGYTDESWTALQAALVQAKAALEQPTVADVSAAYNALRAAVDGLVDLSQLRADYQKYSGHENDGYTNNSWAAFQKALKDAEDKASS